MKEPEIFLSISKASIPDFEPFLAEGVDVDDEHQMAHLAWVYGRCLEADPAKRPSMKVIQKWCFVSDAE